MHGRPPPKHAQQTPTHPLCLRGKCSSSEPNAFLLSSQSAPTHNSRSVPGVQGARLARWTTLHFASIDGYSLPLLLALAVANHSVRMSDHCSIDAQHLRASMDNMSPCTSIDQGIGLPPHASRRHRSRRRRGRLACPSIVVLAALCCFFAAAFCHPSHAFSSPSFTRRRTKRQ